MLMALADIEAIMIRAVYVENQVSVGLSKVALDHADPYGRGGSVNRAVAVELCQCPTGYTGSSCEVNRKEKIT